MNIPVVMPQLGLTMTEGTVNAWLIKPGDTVRKGDMIFAVSTDKADMEVEAMDEGTLSEIVVNPGKSVRVGTVVAYLSRPDDKFLERSGAPTARVEPAAAVTAAKDAPTPAGAKAQVEAGETFLEEERRASPRARRVARELGVDLSKIAGSGSGPIVEEDVRAAQQTTTSPAQVASGVSEDLRRRRLIAEKLILSIQNIPHFAVAVEVNAKELLVLRDNLKGAVQQHSGVKLTVTDLLLKAVGLAVAETPQINSVWENGNLRARNVCDLGLAIATDKGVVGPVIRGVDALKIVDLARARKEVAEKARARRLSLPDLEGGIGTLSNLGMYRVDAFQALITPGQSFVLATGRIENRPWVDRGALIVAPTLKLNLSVDHRVADGALAAQFLGTIAELIENPYRLIWA